MPGYGNFVLDKGYKASAAITKFRAVKMSGAPETVSPSAAVTDNIVGIAQYSVSAGEITNGKRVSVRHEGISEMEISEAINEGDEIAIVADGRAAVAVATERVIGVALSAAGTAGNRIAVQLSLPGHIKA